MGDDSSGASCGSSGGAADQLFVAAFASEKAAEGTRMQIHAMLANGQVYRLTPAGELKLVASGFRFAVGVHFVEHRL